MNILGCGDLPGNDVKISFHPDTRHTDRIGNSLFVIYRIFLGYDVQDLITGRQYQLVHVADELIDIALADFGMIVIAR